MKRLVPLVVLALAACSSTPPPVTSTSASSSPPPTTTSRKFDQSEEIQIVFAVYVKALRTKDGEIALAVMASTAISRWEEYRLHALKSTEAQLAALPAGQRATVYGLRATVDPAVLRAGNGSTVLITAVQQGLISLNTSTKLVYADGTSTVTESNPVLTKLILGADTATAEIGSDDPGGPPSSKPLKFTFVREGERWKADPTSLADTATAALEEVAAQKGTTVDQVLTQALTAQYGAARAAEIRRPLGG
ncbi:hypothetical protein [Lentzea albidocapillata]|uniref:hypothetical protein n=1 Tax=Lentzea albidocapillata TaxID=40571 RepID=UPI00115FF2D7|nr:hypothetical protein [Lentzea albidocapillata]